MRSFRRATIVGAALALIVASPATAVEGPNDPHFSRQYGPVQIGAPDAWTKATGRGVTIAVVDTGIDRDHEDFAGKLAQGYDFVDGDNNPSEEDGSFHGTHVAGIAAAVTNNGKGMAGVAPDSRILPVRVLGESEGLRIDAVTSGIRYSADQGAKVINLSLTDYRFRFASQDLTALVAACEEVFARGSLCIVASGNDANKPGGRQESGYERDFNAVVVTANDRDGKHAAFGQNADTKWGISAPGVAIQSTMPRNEYTEHQGTSMAAPHVAGVAALLFATGLNARQVAERLVGTARGMGNPVVNGAGIVDAAEALGVARTYQPPSGEANRPSGGGGGVLLPKAATRTTVAPGAGRTAPVATAAPGQAQPAGGDAPVADDAPTSAGNDPDFAGDLISGEGDAAIGAGGPEDEDVGQMLFYTSVAIASIMTLGTGLSTLARVRRRFSRSA